MGLGYFFGYQSVQIVMGFVDLEWIFFFFGMFSRVLIGLLSGRFKPKRNMIVVFFFLPIKPRFLWFLFHLQIIIIVCFLFRLLNFVEVFYVIGSHVLLYLLFWSKYIKSVNAILVPTFWSHFYFGPYIFIFPLLVPKMKNAFHFGSYRDSLKRKYSTW